MLRYRLTHDPDYVVRIDGDTWTTVHRSHPMWQGYEEYRAQGGVPEPADPSPAAIEEVTMRQARLQLLSMGLLTEVSAAIAAMEGAAGEVARIEWEYAQTVRRDNPTVQAILAELAFTPDQVDAFFAGAAAL